LRQVPSLSKKRDKKTHGYNPIGLFPIINPPIHEKRVIVNNDSERKRKMVAKQKYGILLCSKKGGKSNRKIHTLY